MTNPIRLSFTERHQLYEWLVLHNKTGRFKGLSRAEAAALFTSETGIEVSQNHVAGLVKDSGLVVDWKRKATIPSGMIKQLHDKVAHLEDRERVTTEAQNNLTSEVAKLRALELSLERRCRDLPAPETKLATAFRNAEMKL